MPAGGCVYPSAAAANLRFFVQSQEVKISRGCAVADFQWIAHRGRDVNFSLDLFESDGETPIVLAIEDQVLVKIGRDNGDDPILDCNSATPLATASVVSFSAGGSAVTFRLAASETAGLSPGAYVVEVDLIDSADDDAFQWVQSGVLSVLDSLAGGDGA
jgi:hypothetical protein